MRKRPPPKATAHKKNRRCSCGYSPECPLCHGKGYFAEFTAHPSHLMSAYRLVGDTVTRNCRRCGKAETAKGLGGLQFPCKARKQ